MLSGLINEDRTETTFFFMLILENQKAIMREIIYLNSTQNTLKKLILTLLIISLNLVCSNLSLAQSTVSTLSEKDELYEKLYNKIVKNVALYHTIKKAEKQNDQIEENRILYLLKGGVDECPIPDLGMMYYVDISQVFFESSLDSNILFYSYSIDPIGYKKYVNYKGVIEQRDILVTAPNEINNKDFLGDPIQRKGLVAFRKKANFIFSFLYVSGKMFLDDIKMELFDGRITPQNIMLYVKLKYFSYAPDLIKNDFIKTGTVAFYSQNLKKNVIILIGKNGMNDRIKIAR